MSFSEFQTSHMEILPNLKLEFCVFQCTEGNLWDVDYNLGGVFGVVRDELVAPRGSKTTQQKDPRFARLTFYRIRDELVDRAGKNILHSLMQRTSHGMNVANIRNLNRQQVSKMLFGTDERIIPMPIVPFLIARLPAWKMAHIKNESKEMNMLNIMIQLEIEKLTQDRVITKQTQQIVRGLIDVVEKSTLKECCDLEEEEEEVQSAGEDCVVMSVDKVLKQPHLEQLIGQMITERRYKGRVRVKGAGVSKSAKTFHQHIRYIPGSPFEIKIVQD